MVLGDHFWFSVCLKEVADDPPAGVLCKLDRRKASRTKAGWNQWVLTF